jgi:hypothetical protein
VVFTSFSTLLFLPAGTVSRQQGAYELYAVAVGVVVLCINGAFVLSVGCQVVRLVEWKALGNKVKGFIKRVASVHKHAAPAAGVPGGADKAVDSV